MGQNQRPKCKTKSTRSDSLTQHLTRGVCSEDMESETMSGNKDYTMSEQSDAGTSRSHQNEDINGNIKIKFMVMVLMAMKIVIQTILIEMVTTNIILEGSKFNPL